VTGCVYVCERDRTGERETGGGGESGSTNESESESKYYKRMTFFPS